MKRVKQGLFCVVALTLLGACKQQTTQTQTSETTQEQSGVVTATSTQSANDYRMLFIDGAYRTSNVRGYSLDLATPENIAEFEKGLMTLSKAKFSTNEYYFAEGQFITKEEVNRWLNVKSDSNPNGLNTTNSGEKDVLVSVLEQDYMLLRNNNFELSGVSIGLALNPQITDGTTLTDEELLARGKAMAESLLPQLRAKEGFGNLPILIGLFKQSVNSGTSKGRYLVSATSTNGNTLSKWADTTVEKRVFPLDKDATSDVSVFNAFKKKIEGFFPSLNGVVGQATFVNGVMTELDIKIVTQFYGQAEMIAFQQFLVEQASATYSATELAVKINVQSVRGSELVVYKHAGTTTYQSVVLQ